MSHNLHGLVILLSIRTGKTGDVLIDQYADRTDIFSVWSFGPDDDQYYQFMEINLATAADKVRTALLENFIV